MTLSKLPPLPDTDCNLCFFNEEGNTIVAGVGYSGYHLERYALAAIEAYKAYRGEVVVTRNDAGQIVAVTRQNEEGVVLSVLATSSQASVKQEPVACVVGIKGSAFDMPQTKRAYTYAEQPGNVAASKMGRACSKAANQSAGDSIDRGLSLLQELKKEGFGVFCLGAEYTAPQPPAQQPLTDEQIIEALRLDLDYAAGIRRFTAIVRAIESAHGITQKGTT